MTATPSRLDVSPDGLPQPLDPGLSRGEQIAALASGATRMRRRNLQMIVEAGFGHTGGDMSATDILATLYLAVLRIDPTRPDDPERDRFVMSKGHSSGVLYVALAAAGLVDEGLLSTYVQPLSPLNGHPDRRKVPGVEANTGPLGHGLPIAVGMALAARLQDSQRRTFVLVGDGELQEGSNWEALMAAAQFNLGRLTVIADRNGLQQGAPVAETIDLEPLAGKARAFGLDVVEVDGHDHGQLLDVFSLSRSADDAPRFVIAHTHKGHPVSFMRDRIEWHHKVPSREQLATALAELDGS